MDREICIQRNCKQYTIINERIIENNEVFKSCNLGETPESCYLTKHILEIRNNVNAKLGKALKKLAE